MSAADAVAELPGGGAFVALWTQVDGDPGSIASLANTLRSSGAKAEETGKSVGRGVGEVGDAWNGPAADAFGRYMAHFASSGGVVSQALDKAAAVVQSAGDAVEQSTQSVDRIANQILDRANELNVLREIPATHFIWVAAVSRAVSEGCSQAQTVVSSLEDKLGSAADDLDGCIETGGWLSMTASGTGTYVAKAGKPIEWKPVPRDPKDSGSTTPQSSTGAGGSGGTSNSRGTSSSSGTGTSGSGSGGSGGSSGGPPSTPPTGNVKTWIDQAKQLLIKSGVPASKINEDDINIIVQHESSGNPHAENGWDSNAAAGTPSKGLCQTIDSTFDAHALPGHTDIWNPVDNICAAVRYALGRYGSLDNVPGVAAVHSGGSYVGY